MRFLRHTAITLAALGLSYCAYGQSPEVGQNPLVQRNVYRDLMRGEQALAEGNWAKGAAYAELVLTPAPIRVHVDEAALSLFDRSSAYKILEDAAEVWTDASHGRVRFEFVNDEYAPVKLRFENTVLFNGLDAAGRAVWSRKVLDWGSGQYQSQISGTIQVRTFAPNGRAMSPAAIRHTAAHELGHLIGLWDSPTPGHIMGPVNPDSPALNPSTDEVGAVNEMLLAADSLRWQALVAQAIEQR